MATATITSKGQLTLPKEVRDRLKLHPGDKVDFVTGPDGSVTLRPVTIDVQALYGFLKKRGQRAVSLEEMDDAIIEGTTGSTT